MTTSYTEPIWGTASDQFVRQQSIFTQAPFDMAAFSGLLIRYMQACFITPTSIVNPELRTLLWNADQKLSKIFIGSGAAVNTANAGQKPGIYISRDEVKTLDINIPPDVVQVSVGHLPSEPMIFNDTLAGAHTIRIESGNCFEAETIGQEVMLKLLIFHSVMKSDAQLRMLNMSNLTKVQKAENGNFVTGVVMSWAADFNYSLPTMDTW